MRLTEFPWAAFVYERWEGLPGRREVQKKVRLHGALEESLERLLSVSDRIATVRIF